MEIKIPVRDKKLLASSLNGHIIQGENNATDVRILLPIHQSGVSLAGYDWEMRGTVEGSNWLAVAGLQKQEKTSSIELSWLISSDFTSEDGRLHLMLVGIKDGKDIFKFSGDKLSVVPNIKGSYAPQPDYLESVLAEIRTLAAQAQASARNAAIIGDNGNWFYFNPVTGEHDIDSGKASGGDKSFVFEQASPADVWVIAHNLGKNPSATVLTSAGDVILSEIEYVNKNTIIIRFSNAFSGVAYLN